MSLKIFKNFNKLEKALNMCVLMIIQLRFLTYIYSGSNAELQLDIRNMPVYYFPINVCEIPCIYVYI